MVLKWLGMLMGAWALAQPIITDIELVIGAGNGPEKRQKAIDELYRQLDPHLPDLLNPYLKQALGLIIDIIVREMNKIGFFQNSAAA